MKKHNLHTHTTYSDGRLCPEDLVKNAIAEGLQIIGISDHAFTQKLLPQYQITKKLDSYLDNLNRLKSIAKDIDIKIGIEIDVSKMYGVDPRELPFEKLNEFDYVMFEYVDTEDESWGRVDGRSIHQIASIRDYFNIPVGLAHNDLQNNFLGKEDETARLLAEKDIFVEFNRSESHPIYNVGRNTRNGFDYYKLLSKNFLHHLSKEKVKVVVGNDSHTGKNMGDLDEVHEFIEKNNLNYHEIVR